MVNRFLKWKKYTIDYDRLKVFYLNEDTISIQLFGEMLSYLNRALFESVYKSNYMTEILDYEIANVKSPDNFVREYSGWRFSNFQERNFDKENQMKYFTDDEFYISESFETGWFRPWKNVISVNDLELDSLFKPVFTRKSPSCIRSDFKSFRQKQSSQGLVLMLAIGDHQYRLGGKIPTSRNLFKMPKSVIWLDYEDISQTSGGQGLVIDNKFFSATSPRPGGVEIIVTKTEKLRMEKPIGSCEKIAENSIKYCKSVCFLDKIKESKECGCTPAWDSRSDFSNECSLSKLTEKSCFDFISALKSNLTEICDCRTPCQDTEISLRSLPYSYGLNGMLSSILIGKDIKNLAKKLKNNSETEWKWEIESHFNNSSKIDHTSLNNDYLAKLLKSYGLSRGKDFDKEISMFKEILSSCIVRLDVFFEEMKVNYEIEVDSDSMSSLISDFGGQLGLWIGISITSVLEVIFLATWCMRGKDY